MLFGDKDNKKKGNKQIKNEFSVISCQLSVFVLVSLADVARAASLHFIAYGELPPLRGERGGPPAIFLCFGVVVEGGL
jgi:hypothetical protein